MRHRALFAVDVGNTRVKIARWRGGAASVFQDGRPCVPDAERADGSCDLTEIERWLLESGNRELDSAFWIVSSVNNRKTARLKTIVERIRKEDSFYLLTLDDLPLEVEYDYPEKLGIDRAVAAFAGVRMLPQKTPFLAIDVGTAATVDYVDQSGVFRGGAILPGPALSAEALTRKTAALPMLDDPENASLDGRTQSGALTFPATETNNGIRLGVVYTLVGAIISFYWQTRLSLERQGANPDDLQLVIAGGDSHATERNLQNYFNDLDANFKCKVPRPRIVVEPRLALYGLAELANNIDMPKRKGASL